MKAKKTILCVDDDRETRILLYEIFSDYGLKVVLGIDGRDGLREFKESRPDIVITDCQMENPTAGLKLARTIKRISGGKIPVILFSGQDFTDTPQGIDFIINKPASALKIIAAVNHFLYPPRRKS